MKPFTKTSKTIKACDACSQVGYIDQIHGDVNGCINGFDCSKCSGSGIARENYLDNEIYLEEDEIILNKKTITSDTVVNPEDLHF